MDRKQLKAIIKESLEQMIFENTNYYQNIAEALTRRVFDRCVKEGYTYAELERVGDGKNSVELFNENDTLKLVLGNDLIYSAPTDILSHIFFKEAEEALYDYFVEKIGHKQEPVDIFDFKLAESRVLQLVKERLLSETGNIFGKVAWAKNLFGEQENNETELEDFCWENFKTDCQNEGKQPSIEEFHILPSTWFSEQLKNFIG